MANKIIEENNMIPGDPINQEALDFGLNVEDMMKAGLHFGHKTSGTHPKMKPYLGGIKSTVHIIDLEKTLDNFVQALKFIKETVSSGKALLFVGTKIQTKDFVENFAKEHGFPYVVTRWLGGTITNFETIKKRIEYFKELENKRKSGELEKYTKKERAKIDKQIKEMETKYGGIKNITKIPDAVFVFDMRKDHLAVKEAIKKGIKIVAIADTNVDPTQATFPILANDDAISSIKYIIDKVGEAIKDIKPAEAIIKE